MFNETTKVPNPEDCLANIQQLEIMTSYIITNFNKYLSSLFGVHEATKTADVLSLVYCS